jgi:hypothetical protein
MIPALLKAKPGYRPQAEDTSIETDLLTFHLLRQRSPQNRLAMAASLTCSARQLSLNCLRQQFGHLTPAQFAQKIARAWLQEYCPPDYIPTSPETMWIQDSISLAAKLHIIFEQLDIPYYITGGVAAIAYGEPRTTQDLDLVLALSPNDIERVASALSDAGFYVGGVDDVKSNRMRTLQITEIESISRADLMVAGADEFDRLTFERRRIFKTNGAELLYFASPEDVLLNKLRWRQYSQSEKQWRDVLGVLKVQGETLDFHYLFRWADTFGLTEPLIRALQEAGIDFN